MLKQMSAQKNGRIIPNQFAREELQYRYLKIVAGIEGEKGRAIAYRNKRRFLSAEGVDASDAIKQLTKLIDDLHAEREAQRADGVPSEAEFLDGLLRVAPYVSSLQRSALARHTASSGTPATFAELARQLEMSEAAFQRLYIRLGRILGQALNFRPRADDVPYAIQPLLVIAAPEGPASRPLWNLRLNFAQAFRNAGEELDYKPLG